MASALLGKLKSRVKGHHVFQSNYTIGDNFVCSPEPDNRHSQGKNAIIVKKPDEDVVLGHVPDALSQIICPMLKDGTIERMTGEITGKKERLRREHEFWEVVLSYRALISSTGTGKRKLM